MTIFVIFMFYVKSREMHKIRFEPKTSDFNNLTSLFQPKSQLFFLSILL